MHIFSILCPIAAESLSIQRRSIYLSPRQQYGITPTTVTPPCVRGKRSNEVVSCLPVIVVNLKVVVKQHSLTPYWLQESSMPCQGHAEMVNFVLVVVVPEDVRQSWIVNGSGEVVVITRNMDTTLGVASLIQEKERRTTLAIHDHLPGC